MKRCAQLMARYAERREIASGRLLDHPVTVARLQDLGAAIFATEALVQAIAAQLDAGNTVAVEAYLACKTAATELFGQAADDLVQMLGGRGYIETNAAPQILRDARVLRILEGPTETLYAHLGATLAQAGSGALAFIGGPLRGQVLADQLAATVAAIQAAATGQQLFASPAALHQWLDYRLGELAAAAFLLAAAESRPQSGHAVAWARQRFAALGHQILAELAVPAPYTTSGALLRMIAQYGVEIGDVDQSAPGEGHQIDPMLRAAPPLLTVVPAPVATVLKKPVAAPRSEGGIHAPTPIQAIVHDAVMTWLRSEKRRTQHDIDFDTPFTSIGMDSLATVSIAVDIENRTGLVIVPELLYDYQTVYTLSAYIETRLATPEAA